MTSSLGTVDSEDLIEELVARGDLIAHADTAYLVATAPTREGGHIIFATTRTAQDATTYLASRPDLEEAGYQVWVRTSRSVSLPDDNVTYAPMP